ncbi:class A beta-lactamase-related serine hydrolase [Niabella ginsengisoli]|uniref:Class A beta-lactamase-related serine hydrolase n=1 Tax=Niabella ginsengisoli TaxID=522298 RepID=A0ABS9SF04_9BACT|nr:class A beta-lactamase-related serine hydrolase [Niabella ginsengisoli]MCH5596901.1 class A beta-lactamase-related serine hydrolase [Niabella ginsengisoli]
MKKIFFFLITFFAVNLLFAQTENYKIAINKFQEGYNKENYDEIFNSFSKEMQEALPLVKTREYFTDLKNKAGKIESKMFTKYRQVTFAAYKAKFEKDIYEVAISLDAQNKINGFYVRPEQPNENETEAVNTLTNYPKKISQIIFSQSKNLPNTAQLSIAIIENGATNYYSIIKENDSIKSINNQTKVFEIGSITKVFTSTILASLVEEKK